jgi:hypothetical protein
MKFGGMDKEQLKVALAELSRRLARLESAGQRDVQLETFLQTRDILAAAVPDLDGNWLDDQLRRIVASSGLIVSDDYPGSSMRRRSMATRAGSDAWCGRHHSVS